MIVVIVTRTVAGKATYSAMQYVSGPRGPAGPAAGEGIDPNLVLTYTIARDT